MVRAYPHKPMLSVLRPTLIMELEPDKVSVMVAPSTMTLRVPMPSLLALAAQDSPALPWAPAHHWVCLIVPPPFPWSPLYGSIRPLLIPLPWSAPHRLFFTICLTRTMTKTPGIIFSTLEKLRPHFERCIRTPINYFPSTLPCGSSAASIPVRVLTSSHKANNNRGSTRHPRAISSRGS